MQLFIFTVISTLFLHIKGNLNGEKPFTFYKTLTSLDGNNDLYSNQSLTATTEQNIKKETNLTGLNDLSTWQRAMDYR